MIEIAEYDPEWAVRFGELRDRIWPHIRDRAIAMEHVGSTSVPGLAAKPVIDVDIVIAAAEDFPAVRDSLAKLGYVHRGDLGIAGREAFRAPAAMTVRHHLYVCVRDSLALRNHLALRDHLRRNAASRQAYAELKRSLALQFPEDVDRYSSAKTEFVVGILAREGISNDEIAAIRQANALPT